MKVTPRFYACARDTDIVFLDCAWDVNKTRANNIDRIKLRLTIDESDGKRRALTIMPTKAEAEAIGRALLEYSK